MSYIHPHFIGFQRQQVPRESHEQQYSRTSLIRTAKEQSEVSELERCPYKRDHYEDVTIRTPWQVIVFILYIHWMDNETVWITPFVFFFYILRPAGLASERLLLEVKVNILQWRLVGEPVTDSIYSYKCLPHSAIYFLGQHMPLIFYVLLLGTVQ